MPEPESPDLTDGIDADDVLPDLLDVVKNLADQVDEHQQLLASHQEAIEQLITAAAPGAGGEPTPATQLRTWTRGPRSREDWETLIAWVDEICAAHAVTIIPPCWLAHEDWVLELEALRAAWISAMATHERRPDSELISWYTYYWRPFLHHVESIDRCRNGHQPDPTATVTNKELLPQQFTV